MATKIDGFINQDRNQEAMALPQKAPPAIN
jgi:hypothetical protein